MSLEPIVAEIRILDRFRPLKGFVADVEQFSRTDIFQEAINERFFVKIFVTVGVNSYINI